MTHFKNQVQDGNSTFIALGMNTRVTTCTFRWGSFTSINLSRFENPTNPHILTKTNKFTYTAPTNKIIWIPGVKEIIFCN